MVGYFQVGLGFRPGFGQQPDAAPEAAPEQQPPQPVDAVADDAARMNWPALKEPLGFLRDHPPHATTISRTLAGVPYEQLQGALTGWAPRVVAD